MRIKLVAATFSLLFLSMCESNDEDTDTLPPNCATVTCLVQTLSIELKDMEGTNLIVNGTYPLEGITVSKESLQMNRFVTTPDSVITFFISGKKGLNSYQIKLNDTETDTLILNLKEKHPASECCSAYFDIIDAKYNGNLTEVIVEQGKLDRIEIIK